MVAGDGTITKAGNTVGGNLIRRSHERKDVEETDPDATSCKQPDARRSDELVLVDQKTEKSERHERGLKDKGAPWFALSVKSPASWTEPRQKSFHMFPLFWVLVSQCIISLLMCD